MIVAHVIPREEAMVRAYNGECVFGVLQDGEVLYTVDLRKKDMMDEFMLSSEDWAFCSDNVMTMADDEPCDLPQGKYIVTYGECSVVEVKTMRNLKALKNVIYM